jgi:hypothetical protein
VVACVGSVSDPTFSPRCVSCGGSAQIDWEQGRIRCQHCGAQQPLASEVLSRIGEYLRRLDLYQRDYTKAAVERDQREREHARLGMPLLLRVVFPLFAGMWTIVSLGAGGCAMFAVMPLAQQYLGDELGGLLGATAFIGVYAALLWSMRLLMVRQRDKAEELPASVIVRETCPGCGGGVPVAVRLASSCPFCGATVVASGSDQQRVESAVRRTVEREKQRAQAATRKAVQSGAENAQAILGAISMVSLLPLLFVALPVTLGRAVTLVVGHALWPASAQDSSARNTLDVVSMVVIGLLAVTFIVVGIITANRKNRKTADGAGD